MKIEEAIIIAATQFMKNFSDNGKTFKILEEYAIEELGMEKQLAKEFAKDGIEGKSLDGLTTDTKKFYLSYYINHVAVNPALS
jgi:hypothetical protein